MVSHLSSKEVLPDRRRNLLCSSLCQLSLILPLGTPETSLAVYSLYLPSTDEMTPEPSLIQAGMHQLSVPPHMRSNLILQQLNCNKAEILCLSINLSIIYSPAFLADFFPISKNIPGFLSTDFPTEVLFN